MKGSIKVRFLKPGPAYGYSYSAGVTGFVRESDLNRLLAENVVEVVVEAQKPETAASKKPAKAEKKIK